MRSIDIHTHVLPPELPGWVGFMRIERIDECRARMVRQDGTLFREIGNNCWDPAARLRECDEAGVEMQVVSTVPVMFAYQRRGDDLARFLNDHLASLCREHPRRFIGLGTLPMQSPDLAVEELERCMRDLGLAGVQI